MLHPSQRPRHRFTVPMTDRTPQKLLISWNQLTFNLSLYSHIAVLWCFTRLVNAYPTPSPLRIANTQTEGDIGLLKSKRNLGIDAAQDEWSGLIAGIAPLVLLVGERITKQHLRESSSRLDYYLLGATPLGLITSVVSLLRLVSLPQISRLIGRSDELLQEACKDITPVNTGNVTSILEAGRVQRGTVETQQGATGVSTNAVSRLHVWEFNLSIDPLCTELLRIRETLRKMNT